MSFTGARFDYQLSIKRAEDFFRLTNLSANPFVDVNEGAKRLGIKILKSPLEGEVSGFLFAARNSQPIIGINEKHSLERQRFSIAHELGHFFLHTRKDTDASFVDKSFQTFNRDSRSSSGVVKEEVEANFFAAEILLPAVNLYSDIAQLKCSDPESIYEELSKRYKVSQEAIKFRLNNLGFVKF